jgi:hypothetical protein
MIGECVGDLALSDARKSPGWKRTYHTGRA